MVCKHCGAEIPDGSKVCSVCGQSLEETPAQPVQPVQPQVVVVQQAAKPARNVGALVCAIIGAVFGILAGILWFACGAAFSDVDNTLGGVGATQIEPYLVAIFGIVGSVLTIIGGAQAHAYKKRIVAIVLSWAGCALQLVALIVIFAWLRGSFAAAIMVGIWNIIAFILSLVAACLSLKKAPVAQA